MTEPPTTPPFSGPPTTPPPSHTAGPLPPTPAHTIGPFYGYALPFPEGGDLAPPGHPDTITVHGYVYDGAGDPVRDALLEFWQAGPDGSLLGAPGSLRRDPVTGGYLGRNGIDFTGFGRIAVDPDGHWTLRTLPPGGAAAPYVSVCIFARGLLHHLFTRIYFPEHSAAQEADPVLALLTPERRRTLIATTEADRCYRFDIHLQGSEETVFLEFR